MLRNIRCRSNTTIKVTSNVSEIGGPVNAMHDYICFMFTNEHKQISAYLSTSVDEFEMIDELKTIYKLILNDDTQHDDVR